MYEPTNPAAMKLPENPSVVSNRALAQLCRDHVVFSAGENCRRFGDDYRYFIWANSFFQMLLDSLDPNVPFTDFVAGRQMQRQILTWHAAALGIVEAVWVHTKPFDR